MDFSIEETNCAENGGSCGPVEEGEGQGDQCIPASEGDGGGEDLPYDETPCDTVNDCPVMEISIWYPTCSGEVLQTPQGTGEALCIEGFCDMDFSIEETDCAENGGSCGPVEEGEGQGDQCIPAP